MSLSKRRRVALVVAGAAAVLIAFSGWQGARAWLAWRGVERIEFDLTSARAAIPEATNPPSESQPATPTPTPTFAAVEYETVLAIGHDLDPNDPDRQESLYADAVLFYLAPTDGGDPVLASLPRDLMVVNPCTGEETKLDRTLAGCGGVSGEELVALSVEDFTGIRVDHFASFGFGAFTEVIDAVGGVELCVDHALREGTTDLLPAGCSVADGAAALMWVRSRGTQEFIDGEWRFVEDVSDLDRVERQQQLMLAMLARLKTMRSPTAVATIAEELGDTLVLDESLSVTDAVGLAWALRSIPASHIRRVVVPTEPAILGDGSFALRATVPFQDLLDR